MSHDEIEVKAIEKQVETKLTGKFDVLDARIDSLNLRIDAIEQKVNTLSRLILWLLGVVTVGIIVPFFMLIWNAMITG